MTFLDVINKLKEIKKRGYIKTHRRGQTGIGKTLEDLLGIKENNIPGPNAANIELKSQRKNAKSMVTLFTKSPLPPGVNSVLLKKFGYKTKRRGKKKELHTTVNAMEFNTLKGKPGFKVDIKRNRVNLITNKKKCVCYWDRGTLKKGFEKKMPKLLYVEADSRGRGNNEEFWYNEATLLSGFSFDNFVKLIRNGDIKIDIRIGKFANGKTHDHGTGFRVLPNKFDLCFEHRKRIM